MNSLRKVIKINKALKAKSSAGRISLRFNKMCARLWPTPLHGEFEAKILTVFLPRFPRLFCLLSSRILQNNLVWFAFGRNSLIQAFILRKTRKKILSTGPPFLPNLKNVVTRIKLDTLCLLHNRILYLGEFIDGFHGDVIKL